mmetsp:Transcript_3122/g.6337  ORF Transcript_3122/g.6337 Transcript_3122/m.6337 type:complete len:82 (+) Transcript_3122:82-327(+)
MAKGGAADGGELAASQAAEADLSATDTLPSDTSATSTPAEKEKEKEKEKDPEVATAPVATDDVQLDVPVAAGAEEDIGDID